MRKNVEFERDLENLRNNTVRQLIWSHRNPSPAELKQLADALQENTSLQRLNFFYNDFSTKEAAQAISELLKTAISALRLVHNNFGSGGAATIGQGLATTQVQQVDLSHNNFGHARAAAIAQGLAATQAQTVYLTNNNFGPKGAAAISQGLATTQARSVCLLGNHFGAAENAKIVAILRQKLNPNLEKLMLDFALPQDILDHFIINRERRIDQAHNWGAIALLTASHRATVPKNKKYTAESMQIIPDILRLADLPSRRERALEKVFGVFSKGILEGNYKKVQAALEWSAKLKKVTAEAPNAVVNTPINGKKALDIIITRLGLPTDKGEEEKKQENSLPKDDLTILQALLEAKCGGEEEAIKLATTYERRDIIDLIRQFQAAENQRYQEAQRKKAILYAASQHQNPPAAAAAAAAAIACAPSPAPTSASTQELSRRMAKRNYEFY